MGVYGLTSFTGAPGVSTTAVAWAYLSDRPTLIVEADTSGGSAILAGVFRATQPHDHSILQLSSRPAGMSLLDHLWTLVVPLPNRDDRFFLPGMAEPQQAGALSSLWEPLGRAFRHLSTQGGYDVLVDLGRYRFGSVPYHGLLQHLDALAVFVPAHLPGINAAAIDLPALRASMGEVEGGTEDITRVGVVLADSPGSTYGPAETARACAPVPVIASLPYAPTAAAVYHRGDSAPRSSVLSRDPSASYRKAVLGLASGLRHRGVTYAETMRGSSA